MPRMTGTVLWGRRRMNPDNVKKVEYITEYTTVEFGDMGYRYQPVIKEELIRCKDCKHWMHNPYRDSAETGLCFRLKHISVALAKYETDFCSDAERKEEC